MESIESKSGHTNKVASSVHDVRSFCSQIVNYSHIKTTMIIDIASASNSKAFIVEMATSHNDCCYFPILLPFVQIWVQYCQGKLIYYRLSLIKIGA